jgi:hypothetical protein
MEPYAVPSAYDMGRCNKLLRKAKESPKNLRFEELCQLAECAGFVFARQNGTSHRIYKRSDYMPIMNFQDVKGQAKPVQVRQLLNTIEELGLLKEETKEGEDDE